MFPAIALASIAGFALGTVYGKFVLADAAKLGAELKAHISTELATVKTAVSTEIQNLRAKI